MIIFTQFLIVWSVLTQLNDLRDVIVHVLILTVYLKFIVILFKCEFINDIWFFFFTWKLTYAYHNESDVKWCLQMKRNTVTFQLKYCISVKLWIGTIPYFKIIVPCPRLSVAGPWCGIRQYMGRFLNLVFVKHNIGLKIKTDKQANRQTNKQKVVSKRNCWNFYIYIWLCSLI